MCGRYYFDQETEKETARIAAVPRRVFYGGVRGRKPGDIRPSMQAPVLVSGEEGLTLQIMRWGYPRPRQSGLIINARAETASGRPMFERSMESRRCVIPAGRFYEWNREKEKVTFWYPERKILFMAGIYSLYNEEERFVILTREANDSVRDVHDRMPLILEPEELDQWTGAPSGARDLLGKPLPLLARRQEYEQLSLEDLELMADAEEI